MEKVFTCFSLCLALICATALSPSPVTAVRGEERVKTTEREDREDIYSLFCELSAYETALLERAVETTAPDGSFALRTALASVMLNRLSSPLYPDSLPKLIRDTGFLAEGDTEPSEKTRQAVLSALLGVSPCSRSTHAAPVSKGGPLPEQAVSYVIIDGWIFWED